MNNPIRASGSHSHTAGIQAIRDVVSLDPTFAYSNQTVAQVAHIMRTHQLSSFPVCDASGGLSGEVDYEDIGDLLQVPEVAMMPIAGSGFVHPPELVVDLTEDTAGLLERMARGHSWITPVMNGQLFVGVVRYSTLVNSCHEPRPAQDERSLCGNE